VFFYFLQTTEGSGQHQILGGVPGVRTDLEFKVFEPEFLHSALFGCVSIFGMKNLAKLQELPRQAKYKR
jgi:hypothetical protein